METKKLTCFLLLLFLYVCAVSDAQAQAAKFGKVDEAELQMRRYDKDTSAAAVVLSDYGYTRFDFTGGLKVIFERHVRIKILKKSGYDWANMEIPFYVDGADKEKVTTIRGYTFNLEGGKIEKDKLDSKSVYEEQRSENWHLKKFTMPNVKEGSVIDVSYAIMSDFVYTMREWEFQTTIPTVWSEYRAQIPQYFDYKFLMQGYHSLYKNDKQNNGAPSQMVNNAYVWAMKDVPALKEEKYITTLRDYQSKIEFELQRVSFPGEIPRTMTGDWKDVTGDLLMSDKFGTQLNRNNFFKDEIAAVKAKHQDPHQQMLVIYDLVKDRMVWDEKYGYTVNNPIRKAYDLRKGNVAEINLLLTSMLLEAGLDAAPMLLSTRNHGRVNTSSSPMVTKFNYVIAHVKLGDKEYLLDATEPLLPAGLLPLRCLNGHGRLIKKEDQRWVALTPDKPYSKLFNAVLTINSQGEIKGEARESVGGYNALALRQTILEEGESKYVERLTKEVGDYKMSKPQIKNLKDVSATLDIVYDISASGSGQENSIIYLNPMFGQGESENPFKLTERIYPVDFGAPIDETYLCRLTIPEGYELEEAPKSIAVNLPENGGRFMYMVQQNGNVIQVMSKVSINKPVFYAPEYPYLKEFYNQIIAKHAEQLVLKRTATSQVLQK
ncbi:uncharacterized protein DUF3857 [Pontibacter ummariensis]|uniref:DUF3857 domain-containing protein n=1 Tax=Pontibacter ummariensis TaxID=1610492 RepID=A0A239E196_9BACT|nr:DUF3857 domain-containing protein [Pontibacter ummariensis]PRY13675.1 uncharacterized protein DUF3857 [Pontibacter ummariensis]SNS37762.1 protein of unknown function [Pontibacter ummariensis]